VYWQSSGAQRSSKKKRCHPERSAAWCVVGIFGECAGGAQSKELSLFPRAEAAGQAVRQRAVAIENPSP
jgi:hypothetical protein